ncbi:MAG: hypothetical protein BWY21_01725 [Parcubacteria group bacterium ADurb.Bin216]|nr:MAG: hypothetical protein BWY21_01725 [Parcubacteria group bacterium ADurb.Bin216]
MYATDETEYTEALTGCSTTLQSINGECPAETNAYTIPTATCISGNPSSISGEGPWVWVCEGINGGANSTTCTVNKITDGVCPEIFNSYNTPVATCVSGNPGLISGTGPWNWTCSGANGGLNSGTCTVNKSVDGACGIADGDSFVSIPTVNLCDIGSASTVSGAGPWNWTCSGENGGIVDNCNADYLIGAYRKVMNISNASGTNLTDYQVRLSVPYNSHMSSSFVDLRFTSGDGKTQLSYWIESYIASTSAIVWVRLPSIPVSGTVAYMYYGTQASTTSNGDNTFIFFDDFLGSSLDGSKWNIIGNNGISVSSGLFNITYGGGGSGGNSGVIETKNLFQSNAGLRMKIQSRTYYTGIMLSNGGGSALGLVYYTNYESAIGSDWVTRVSSSASTDGDIIPDPPAGYYIEDFICINGQKLKERRNDGTWNISTRYNGHSTQEPLRIVHYRGYGGLVIDWILLRNVSSVEPTISFGVEEVN